MYGMVNKAIEDLVTRRFGEDTWSRIKAAAGVEVDVFVSNEPYPDDVTYRLVAAASQALGVTGEQVLEMFGVHWVLVTARDGYGDLLDASGRTLCAFLQNLPSFHSRIALIFPDLEPPSFDVTDVVDGALRLHYRSRRPGLAPFVVGLVRGLGAKFDTEVHIEHAVRREAGADHDEFVIRWTPGLPA